MNLYAIMSLFIVLSVILLKEPIKNAFTKAGLNKTEAKIATVSAGAAGALLILIPIAAIKFPRIMAGLFLAFAIMVTIAAKKISGEKITRKAEAVMGLILVVLVTGAFSYIMSVRSYPIAEGWYSAYAMAMNEQGAVPYKDFELLFTPTYTYIIALFTKIFGYELMSLRIFGVVIFVTIAVLMYVLFSKLFESWSVGTVCAITSAMYFQSSVAQVFYDYIRFLDISVYLASILIILFIRQYLKGEEFHKGFSLKISAVGILAAICFLVKQNSGAMIIAYVLCLMIGLTAISDNKKILIKNTINYIVFASVPFAVTAAFMAKQGILGLFFEKTTTSAISSKGGMSQVLFGWIPRTMEITIDYFKECFCLLAVVAVCYLISRKSKDMGDNIKTVALIFGACSFVSVFVIFRFRELTSRLNALYDNEPIIYALFFVTVVLFIIELAVVIINRKDREYLMFRLPLFATMGMAIALNYGVATSGGLSAGQTAMNLGLMIGLVLYLSKGKNGIPAVATTLTFCIFLTTGIIAFKYEKPYYWWQLQEGDVRDATYELDVPYLHGIKVTRNTYDGINRIYKGVTENSEEGDSVFIFPHAPVFYMVTGRFPDTYTYVQWYDVSSDQAVAGDVRTICQDLPKVIVHIHVPENVTNAQEANFRDGKASGLRLMDNALTVLENNGAYTQIDHFDIQTYSVDIYVRE